MLYAIVVGHTARFPGAYGSEGLSEYAYNTALGSYMCRYIEGKNHDAMLFQKDGFTHEEVCEIVEEQRPVCAVELHCNAFNTKVRGTETLFAKNHIASERYAFCVHRELVHVLKRDERHDRGIKELIEGDRGYGNLVNYRCPAFIVEPFFIDNVEDCHMGIDRMGSIGMAICDILLSCGEIHNIL